MLASVEVQTALLVLKICFLVLLYLFIWRIVRSASREVRMPQESFIMGPQQAAAAGLGRQPQAIDSGVLVTVRSNALEQGSRFELNAKAITLGRSASNDIRLGDDEFASSRHARIEPRRDGVWVEDIGSTNGTYVNGTRLGGAHKLAHGDVVRVGETDLRYER
jgi:pSer/pThr/pTyr-binding forkhead associated (FHA) protein